jgi:hypothetical protein
MALITGKYALVTNDCVVAKGEKVELVDKWLVSRTLKCLHNGAVVYINIKDLDFDGKEKIEAAFEDRNWMLK